MNQKLKKVISWRAVSFFSAGTIAYLYLGEFRSSVELTIIMTAVMTAIHYSFETLWEKYE